MELPNIFNIIIADLLNDRLQFEAELERIVNMDISTPEKTKRIKNVLKEITLIDSMLQKWQEYLPEINNENSKE
jgi:hypothetical protein